jgi:glycosyltransferase involved in cell wall biosynthesis
MHGEALLNEAPDYAEAVAGGSESRPRIFTFASPEIGLRQGFEMVYQLFSDPEIAAQDIRLHVVGNPVNNYFANRINQLKSQLDYKIKVRGWIGTGDAHYANIMTSSDFIVYPALDGGQAPTVLDALRRGTIPLLSRHAGVDFSPLGMFNLTNNLKVNKQLILDALHISAGELSAWKKKSVDYYKEYHSNSKLQLEKTLKDCIGGGYLYPKVSVTLPIFNKETTIVSLLADLDQALGEYPNAELHIIFDGCSDKSDHTVKQFFFGRSVNYSVTYETTPNIFEVRSNNIGLRKSTGEYCVILQDDNYILDRNLFFEAVNFLEKNRGCAILGCLSGVNFYPRGTVLSVPGQTASKENEVYWRQDANADPELKHRMFETDACMRGPLFIRKSFLLRYGYLDETYAPLYQDDMDLSFRARHYGWKVYGMLADVENRSLTMSQYDSEKNLLFSAVMKRNTDIFYARWNPGIRKDYTWIHRIPIR